MGLVQKLSSSLLRPRQFRSIMDAAQVFAALVIFGAAAAYAQETLYTCESGWYLNGDRCYKKFDTEVKFSQARTKCNNKGGGVALVKDQALHADLVENLDIRGIYFVGGSY